MKPKYDAQGCKFLIFMRRLVGLIAWMTDIDMTAGKEERSTETTNLPTVIMDSSGGDESHRMFVKISSIIDFPE